MRKRIFMLMLTSLMLISSFGVSAIDKDKMKNFTGWWFDKDTQQTYHFDNGNSTVNWLKEDNRWYYFNADGIMQKGWLTLNNVKYFLNTMGVMQTGWMETAEGKWYYFNNDGSMAHDTTIEGYKVGSDGAWIK